MCWWMVSGHLVRREDEVLPSRVAFVICGTFQRRNSGWKWAGGAEWISPPGSVPRGWLWFSDRAAIYSLWHAAPRRSRDLFRRQTLPSPGSCTNRGKCPPGDCQPPKIHLSLPCLHRFSALMNRRDLMGRVWWENGVLGWQNGLIQSVVLAKLLKQGTHLLTHQQGYF